MLRLLSPFILALLALLVPPVLAVQHGPAALHAAESSGHHDPHHIGHAGVDARVEAVDPDLVVYTIVVFLILFALLYIFAWKPIAEALDKREAGVREHIAAAELTRKRAEQMLDEHAAKLASVQDEVKAILAEARRDADHTRQEIVAEARAEAEASRNRAIVDIERARDAALKELFDRMGELVTEATAHVVGRSLNDADHGRLIDEALTQFQRDRALRN